MDAMIADRAGPGRRRRHGGGAGRPPRLAAAMRYAVFPGGARIRPRLCLAVAAACGDDDPAVADGRRGRDRAAALRVAGARRPAVLRRCGDAPRQAVGPPRLRRAAGGAGRRRADRAGLRDARARRAWHRRSGSRRWSADHRRARSACPCGIVAGQAWECEPQVDARRIPAREDRRAVRRGHRWRAPRRPAPSRGRGARSASGWARPTRWPTTSATSSAIPSELGKPVGRDVALGRPSAVQRARPRRRRRAACSTWCACGDRVDPGLRRRRGAARRTSTSARPTPAACRGSWRAARRDAAGAAAAVSARPGREASRRRRRRGATAAWRGATACSRVRGSGAGRRAFPLTRPIARRRARAVFDLCAGFVYSQVLLACVGCELFEMLAEGPQSSTALAPRLGLSPDADRAPAGGRRRAATSSRRARRAATGSGRSARRWSAIPAIAAMVEHHALLYADLADPVALLRGRARATATRAVLALRRGRRGRRRSARRGVAPYTRADGGVAAADRRRGARRLSAARASLPARRRRRRRRFPVAAAARAPRSARDAVRPAAGRRAGARALRAPRACRPRAAVGGRLPRRPAAATAPTSSRWCASLHDHDDAARCAAARGPHARLPPGGTLLMAEPMAGTPGAEPSATPISASTCWRWAAAAPRTPRRARRDARARGLPTLAAACATRSCRCRPALIVARVRDSRQSVNL